MPEFSWAPSTLSHAHLGAAGHVDVELLNFFVLLLQNCPDSDRQIFIERVPIDFYRAIDDALGLDPDSVFVMPIHKSLRIDPACEEHSGDALRIGGIKSRA